MKSHEVDYEILGEDRQMVEVELDPGETLIAEAGAMNYMEDGIVFETKMGDGTATNEGIMGTLMNIGKRVLPCRLGGLPGLLEIRGTSGA